MAGEEGCLLGVGLAGWVGELGGGMVFLQPLGHVAFNPVSFESPVSVLLFLLAVG